MMNEGELELCNTVIFSAKVGFEKFLCTRQVYKQENNSNTIMLRLIELCTRISRDAHYSL